MNIWGKIIGGFLGLLLAGPFGILLGVWIGHFFDRAIASHAPWSHLNQGVAKEVFFTSTFLVMGYIAKLDGRVSEAEIETASAIMQRMGLTDTLRKRAIDLFNQGKQSSFQLDTTLKDLRQGCQNKTLLRMFIEIQTQAALADGHLSVKKQRVLEQISQYLGFAPVNFSLFEHLFAFQKAYQERMHSQQEQFQRASPASHNRLSLEDAYAILGIQKTASAQEVKRAYRRLMSQHHPDRLLAKGLPESMIKMATEKTQNIKAAYDVICAQRGM